MSLILSNLSPNQNVASSAADLSRRSIRIGIVAGETSGDLLGAGLMQALISHWPDAEFVGIGGERMQRLGCRSLFPMEKLSIIGVVELLGSLLAVLKIRRKLIKYFISEKPNVFIGIDAPQFNIGLEEKLKEAGIPTIHYVGPTVWAWRRYRIHHIRRAVDHMLVLFPFEEKIYQQYNIPVTFVGHPQAELLSTTSNPEKSRAILGLQDNRVVVGLLPGSRTGELKRHAELFIKTAQWLHQRNSKIVFAASFINSITREIFENAISNLQAGELPITITEGSAREVMQASDVLVVASGTATLEAAMLRKPMVITYRVNWISYFIIKMLSHVRLYSLPNNLIGYELLPEFLQYRATPGKIGKATEFFLAHPEEAKRVREVLEETVQSLRLNSNEIAADVVMTMVRKRR